MPPAKPNGFLNNALKSNKDGFGTIVSSNNDLCMARKHGKLFLTTIPTALQMGEPAIDRTLHSFNHFQMKWGYSDKTREQRRFRKGNGK